MNIMFVFDYLIFQQFFYFSHSLNSLKKAAEGLPQVQLGYFNNLISFKHSVYSAISLHTEWHYVLEMDDSTIA